MSTQSSDLDGEVKHARNIISACCRAGVKKMVYSSATCVSDYPKMIADGRLEFGSFLATYALCQFPSDAFRDWVGAWNWAKS
jgi:hypothetical protein